MLAPRFGVRANVQQRDLVARHGQGNRERGPIDAVGTLDVEDPRGERSAGAAGAHERLCSAVGDGAGSLHDRGVGGRARGGDGVGRLRDGDRRVDDLDARAARADLLGGAEQDGADSLRGGDPRAGCDLGRAEIRPVAVDRHNASR